MRNEAEIQAAHDRLVAILLEEVPNPFGDNPKAESSLTAACDVLCWVLDHKYNQSFKENLRQIDSFLAESGLVLKKGSHV